MLGIKKKKVQKQKNTKSKPLIISIGKKQKSKSRSASCIKNQQNNKVKINKNKPFISMNEDPEKSTINDKKIHHQSLYSLQEIQKITTKKKKKLSPKINKKIKLNHNQLFILKNEAIRKREVFSALQIKKKSREKLKKSKIDKKLRPLHSSSILTNKEKKINSQNSLKQYSLLALQSLFQNHSNLMSVTSNGQIQFSSKIQSRLSEEKRQIFQESIKVTIKDPNLLFNLNLKKQYKKKVAAVTKIQKIWRGYQTRKLLKQYIIQQEPKLTKMLEQFKGNNFEQQKIQQIEYNHHNQELLEQIQSEQNNTHNHSQQIKYQTLVQENSYNPHISYFQQKDMLISETIKKPQNISQYKNILDDISAIKNNHQGDKSHIKFQKQLIQQEKIQDHKGFQPEESQSDEEDSQEGQQNMNLHIYRRQKPIFSHEDLNDYLKQSKQKHQEQLYYDQEEQQKDIHQPKIILETSEQYIQTRKTSMQQKKGGKKDNDLQSRKISYETYPQVIKNQSNQKWQISLGEQNKQQQQIKETKSGQIHKINNNDNQIDHIKTIENEEKSSTKEDYKQEIIKIKNQEINKWARMIQFIKDNFKGNTADEEYSKIMNQIVHQSQANKKWLEKNMNKCNRKQNQTVETRIYTQQDTFIKKSNNKQDFCFSNEKSENNISVSLNVNNLTVNNNTSNEINLNNQIKQNKKFKKKNLELDLKSIGNSFINPIIKEQFQLPDIKQKSSEQFSSVKIQSNWNLPLLESSQKSNKSKRQLQKHSLKNIISSKFNNFSTSNLNDIISIRQELLKERQTLEFKKLQNNLLNKQITVQQFENKKVNILKYIENEQYQIEKAKQEIEKGLKMAAKVVAKTQRDAQFLGKSIKISKSQENIKKIKPDVNHLELIQGIPSHILYVDERKSIRKESQPFKNFFNDDSKSNSSDAESLDLTDQELKRFKDPKFTNLEFIDMNKNVMISEEFLKSHKINSYEKAGKKLKIEINDSEQNSIQKDSKTIQYVPEIVNQIVKQLLLQLTVELYEYPNIFETINIKYQLFNIKPPIISNQQILKFIQLIDQLLPDKNLLLKRLNQKISPSPLQLLKCMRVDLSDQQQNQIDESGKYQFIIPQSICMNAISKFLIKQSVVVPKIKNNQDIEIQKLLPTTKKYIENREKIISIKKQEALKKKKQIFNILMHCIFDSWNQQIITLKTQIPGFSGIGLNQSTLSLQNQNIQISIDQVDKYIKDSRNKVINIIQDNNQLTKKINMMAYQQMCYNESTWINYSDEALGYFLELDYIIVEQLMAEIARFLQKKMFKESMFNNVGNPRRLISDI